MLSSLQEQSIIVEQQSEHKYGLSVYICFDSTLTKNRDTAGQEKYRAITDAYYRGSQGAMVVYDVSKRDSFEAVERWLAELKQSCDPNIVVMIVGNKADLEQEREVSLDEGTEMSKANNAYFIETSALDGSNVEKAFTELLVHIYEQKNKKPDPQNAEAEQPEAPKEEKPEVQKVYLSKSNEKSSKCC